MSCKSTAKEVSFEWSHHRISSTDSKAGTALHVSIIDSGRERVKAWGAAFLGQLIYKCGLPASFYGSLQFR